LREDASGGGVVFGEESSEVGLVGFLEGPDRGHGEGFVGGEEWASVEGEAGGEVAGPGGVECEGGERAGKALEVCAHVETRLVGVEEAGAEVVEGVLQGGGP